MTKIEFDSIIYRNLYLCFAYEWEKKRYYSRQDYVYCPINGILTAASSYSD